MNTVHRAVCLDKFLLVFLLITFDIQSHPVRRRESSYTSAVYHPPF
jgi:hypothetical protein